MLTKWVNHAMNGAAVKRYHTIPTINSETVGEHSFGVAMMVLAITEQKASANLLKAALFHDMAEQHTGDVPFPSKKAFPIVKFALEAAEESWNEENGFHVDLTDRDKRVLKWADMSQLLWFCKIQRDLGNTNMDEVFSNGVRFLKTLEPEGRCLEIFNWLISNYKG